MHGETRRRAYVCSADAFDHPAVDGSAPADDGARILALRLGAFESGNRLSFCRGQVSALAGLGEDPLELRVILGD